MALTYTQAKKSRRRFYEVHRDLKGGVRTMLRTHSMKEARAFYRKHPRAAGIQRYVRGGITAGFEQPGIPSKVRSGGKTYERPYLGPFSKQEAQKFARGFRKDGHRAVVRKYRHGWHLFVKLNLKKRRR